MSETQSKVALLGMGNPLLDMSTDAPEELLTKYDLESNNAILAEEKHMPLYSELVDSYEVQLATALCHSSLLLFLSAV